MSAQQQQRLWCVTVYASRLFPCHLSGCTDPALTLAARSWQDAVDRARHSRACRGTQKGFFDGVSTFRLDGTGKIYEHLVRRDRVSKCSFLCESLSALSRLLALQL